MISFFRSKLDELVQKLYDSADQSREASPMPVADIGAEKPDTEVSLPS